MCGRFSRADDSAALAGRFKLEQAPTVELEPRYNVAPGQMAAVIVKTQQRRLEMMRWGLVPFWAKDEKIGYKAVNARAESLAGKPMFKAAYQARRCLVPADGFYEWQKQGKAKMPWRFLLKDHVLFALAGLWESWQKPDGGRLNSFTIITTAANDLVKKVHERMPLILRRDDEETWLSAGGGDMRRIDELLRPYPAKHMTAYPVSERVNSAANEGVELIEPLAEHPGQPGLGF
jgi:putative SOS response-associated peptidase YedK